MKNNGEKEAEEDGVGGRGGDGKATEGNSFREKRQRREGETRKLKKWTKGGGGGGMGRNRENEVHGQTGIAEKCTGFNETVNTSDEAVLSLSLSLLGSFEKGIERKKERHGRSCGRARERVWHGRISIAGESETVDEMMKDGGRARERERERREPKIEYR